MRHCQILENSYFAFVNISLLELYRTNVNNKLSTTKLKKMKKLLLIFAIATIYAVSASSVKANVVIIEKQEITIVDQADDNVIAPEDDKKKDKKKENVKAKTATSGCCPSKTEVKTGCSEAQQKSCAASKVTCTETKKEDKK